MFLFRGLADFSPLKQRALVADLSGPPAGAGRGRLGPSKCALWSDGLGDPGDVAKNWGNLRLRHGELLGSVSLLPRAFLSEK